MAHILLVEDNWVVLNTLRLALQNKGHTVVDASNGEEALNGFEGQSFDLIITDIIMPNMVGIEMIKEMRRSKPHAKIIAISGGGSIGNVESLHMAGMVGAMATLKKPFPLARFNTVVEECLKDARTEWPPHARVALA